MKAEYVKKSHSCILLTLDQFRSILNKLYPEDTMYVDVSMDGLYVGKSDDDIPVEDLHDRLAAEFGVDMVTSIHIDDCELCGVWIAYRNSDMLCRSDYIASKLWSEEDVEEILVEEGYEGTEEEIKAVIETGYLRALNECTESDWEIIRNAVSEAETNGKIRKI